MANNDELGLVFVPPQEVDSDCRRFTIRLLKLVPLTMTLGFSGLLTYDLVTYSEGRDKNGACLPRSVAGTILLAISLAGVIPWAIYPISSSDHNWLVPAVIPHTVVDTIFYNYLGLAALGSWASLFPTIFMNFCSPTVTDFTKGVYLSAEGLLFVCFGTIGTVLLLCYLCSTHFKIQRLKQSIKTRLAKRSERFLSAVASGNESAVQRVAQCEYAPPTTESYLCPIELQHLGNVLIRRLVPSLAQQWGFILEEEKNEGPNVGDIVSKQKNNTLGYSRAKFECALCHTDIKLADRCTRVQPCFHKYHWECFKSWASCHPKCVGCKSDLFNTRILDRYSKHA